MNNINWKATGSRFLQAWVKVKSVSELHWSQTLNLEKLLWLYLWYLVTGSCWQNCTCYYTYQIFPQKSEYLFFRESTEVLTINTRFSVPVELIILVLLQWWGTFWSVLGSNCSPATICWLLNLYFFLFYQELNAYPSTVHCPAVSWELIISIGTDVKHLCIAYISSSIIWRTFSSASVSLIKP